MTESKNEEEHHDENPEVEEENPESDQEEECYVPESEKDLEGLKFIRD